MLNINRLILLLISALILFLFTGCKNLFLLASDESVNLSTVTYNANGATSGTVPLDPAGYKTGSSVIAKTNEGSLAYNAYTFAGWNTKADGTGTTIAAGSLFTMGINDIKLYAKWVVYINYDKNDNLASGIMPLQEVLPGTTIMLNTNNYIKANWTFQGWATSPPGPVVYTNDQSYSVGHANVTLFAKWTISQYTLTYNLNGGSGSLSPITQNYNTTVSIANQTGLSKMHDGIISMHLERWTTEAGGGGDSYIPGSTFIFTENKTLYAQWSIVRGTGPGGGHVFFDKGFYSNGWRYIEVAPEDQSTGYVWSNVINVYAGTSSAVGQGKENTDIIIVQAGHTQSAAQICRNYTGGGYTDWFLPSVGEINLIKTEIQEKGIGNINGVFYLYYWSSTESNSTQAERFSFDPPGNQGSWNTADKSGGCHVRAARRF